MSPWGAVWNLLTAPFPAFLLGVVIALAVAAVILDRGRW